MTRRKKIAYYITPHGFGHAIRSLEVIRCLLDMEDGPEIILVSDLPDFLVEQNVGRPIPVRRKRLDIGLIQQDSIRFDIDATLEALERLRRTSDRLITEEVAFLESQNVDGVVSDVPFLAVCAASQYGIPSIGVGNFTWDWIYESYARSDRKWGPIIDWIRECYGRCDVFLQLPMHGDCSACPRLEDVPLVARKARLDPRKTREILGCGRKERAYLISFADLKLDEDALRRIGNIDGAVFFYKHPLRFDLANGRSLDDFDLSYVDIVAAVDGVITKPGYGIASDCLAHGTPMIYTDRGVFPEYEILVREMERHLDTVYIKSSNLYAGLWETAIRQLEARSRRAPGIMADGAPVCARSIMARLE